MELCLETQMLREQAGLLLLALFEDVPIAETVMGLGKYLSDSQVDHPIMIGGD